MDLDSVDDFSLILVRPPSLARCRSTHDYGYAGSSAVAKFTPKPQHKHTQGIGLIGVGVTEYSL